MRRSTRQQRVTAAELAQFCRQFGTMLSADVHLLPVVQTLRQQVSSEYLREVLQSVEEDLEMGRTLAVAFSRFPQVFTPFFIQLIRQGEMDGALGEVLLRLAEHYESEAGGSLTTDTPQLAVDLDVGAIMEAMRPLFLWVALSLSFIAFSIAGLWYATKSELVSPEQFGPNVALTVGVAVLLIGLLFSRFRPRMVRRCSFCGRLDTEVDEIVTSRGVSICSDCVMRTVSQMRQAGAMVAEQDRREITVREPDEPVDLDEEVAREEAKRASRRHS